jgi:hypothetical protein
MCKNNCKGKERGPYDKKIYESYMVILLEFSEIVFLDYNPIQRSQSHVMM